MSLLGGFPLNISFNYCLYQLFLCEVVEIIIIIIIIIILLRFFLICLTSFFHVSCFLGAFAQSRKAPVKLCHALLSVSLHVSAGLPLAGFLLNLILGGL